MKTQAEFVARVLGMLGVIQVGQEPYADDADIVLQYIPGKFEELAKRQILYVQNPDCIEDAYFIPLAKIIANAVGPEFGQAYSPDTDDREETRLRDINRGQPVYSEMRGEYL